LARLVAVYDCWLDYCRRRVFPGGCFFFGTAAEYHARPGRVRDALAEVRRRWLEAGAGLVAAAQDRGELDPACDPEALVFELDALGMAATLDDQLRDDAGAYDRARAAMLARLRAVATAPHPALD
jgi:hypothetical protein